MRKLTTLLFFLTFYASISAQHNWISTNPGGGGAISMVGATKSGLIVAGGDLSGAYISSDNGASWKVIGKAQGLTETQVTSLGFHPTNGNTFIIGTSIGPFKTKDGGNIVYPVSIETNPNLGPGLIESIGMAMSDANIGYLAHHEWWVKEMTFLKTTDAGESWQIVNTTGLPDTARIIKILVDQNDATLVYALTGKARYGCSDPYLYRSTDSGQNWTRIATTIPSILDFDLHPTNPNIIYVSSFSMHADGCLAEMYLYAEDVGEVYKSTDAGVTFSPIFDNLSGMISVGNDPLNISVTDIILDNGTWKTTDGGTNWSNTGPRSGWFKGWADDNWAFTSDYYGYAKVLTKDRFNPDRCYGAFGQWAWSSIDGGDHINNISTKEISPGHFLSTGLENVEANWIDVNDNDPNYIYLGAFDLGFWYSSDHGASWKKSLPDEATYGDYTWWAGGGSNCNFVVSDPADASIVWATFGASQPNTVGAIFKSTDHGETWTISNTNLDAMGAMTHGLSIDNQSPTNNRTLYVTQAGDVWKSTNGGDSWTKVFANGGLKFTEVDKFNSQIVYAGGEAGFFRSTDAGSTWTETGLSEMGFTPTAPAIMRPDIVPETDIPWDNPPVVHWQGVFNIKADPNIPNRVYVVVHGDDKGLYRSDDAGATGSWEKLYTNSRMRDVAIAPGNSDILYLSSSTNYHSGGEDANSIGMLVSYDAGASWSFANDGLAWTNGGHLDIESGANPHVWAWMPGTGIHHALIPNFVLPVTILSPFTARLQDDSVLLKWETSEEIQNDGFTISRSKDGIHWTPLQSIAPNHEKKYVAIDQQPLEGISYYKLTQKDLDGQITDLGTASVQFNRLQRPNIYPNPTHNILHISFAKKSNMQELALYLYDSLGRLMLSQKNNKSLDISDLPRGSYHLAIRMGEDIWHERVMKE